MNMMTTSQVANKLKISERRVRQLIHADKIVAIKVGRDWVIDSTSLSEVKIYGKPGRPSKKIGSI